MCKTQCEDDMCVPLAGCGRLDLASLDLASGGGRRHGVRFRSRRFVATARGARREEARMTAPIGRQTGYSRIVSLTVGEPKVRPAGFTTNGHHFQRRRSRLLLV